MIPSISGLHRLFPLRVSLGLLLAFAVALGHEAPASAQTATMNPPGTAFPNLGSAFQKLFTRPSAGTATAEALALAPSEKRLIGGAVAAYGVIQTIKLYSFGKTMEYFIEDARDTNSKDEYTNDVSDIQAGIRKHWLTGPLVVGNEITANMHSHPAQSGKLCQLMSDVGVTPAPSVAAQIGCKGAGQSANNQAAGQQGGSSAAAGAPNPDDPDQQYCKLIEDLALQQAKGQRGTVIASGDKIKDLNRLISQYGAGTWEKVAYVYKSSRGNIDVHFYRNVNTGVEEEYKIGYSACK